MTGTNTSTDSDAIDRLCENCGQTFSTFLHDMADQNAKVVCPNCRENRDCTPAKAPNRGAGAGPVSKSVH